MGACVSNCVEDAHVSGATEDTPNWRPPIRRGKVVAVYDGDTITVASRVASTGPWLFKVRLVGIDAPEMRAKDAAEKAAATEARDALRGEILNTIVDLDVQPNLDKYGRILARVTRQRGCLGGRKEDMSTWLLDRGYAVPYDGGAKPARVDWAKLRRQAQEQRI